MNVVDELHRKFREKFPDKMVELEAFLFIALQSIEIVPTPEEEKEAELTIRDVKDRPILRAALDAGADLFLMPVGLVEPAGILSNLFGRTEEFVVFYNSALDITYCIFLRVEHFL